MNAAESKSAGSDGGIEERGKERPRIKIIGITELCPCAQNHGAAIIAGMHAKVPIPPEFDAAPSEQQIEFVQELWDRIARDPESVPVPGKHKRILDDRLDAYESNPEPGRSWSEVRDELLEKLRNP